MCQTVARQVMKCSSCRKILRYITG
ncbi:MAG: hypothetical protein ACI4C5_03370 [Lachnospiraceae bacterium]